MIGLKNINTINDLNFRLRFLMALTETAKKLFTKKQPAKLSEQQIQAEQDVTLDAVDDELARARSIHGAQAFNSLHEAYGVILEEVEELWTEIKAKKPDLQKVHDEAIQVAAMAVRLATETRTKIEAQTEAAQ